MNTKQLTAALVLFTAAGAALAEAPYPPETKFVSTKTRSEVIAELKQAQAQGLITNGDNYPIQAQFHSTLTHSQVVSQLNQGNSGNMYSGA